MARLAVFIALLTFITGSAFSETGATELKMYTVRHGKAIDMADIVVGLKSSEGKMSVDPNTNTIIVVDYPENLARITEVIDRLDAVQKQVQIKVAVADTTDEVMKAIGISSGRVIIPGGDFGAALRMLNTSRGSKVRSEMTVRTLSNKPAKIQVSAEEIFGYSAVIGHHWVTLSPETISAGEMLEVLPVVNNDGTILVKVQPSSSEFREDGTIAEKTVLTEVVVNNGDTVAIGGVDTAEESGSKGTLFSRRSRKEARKAVMFLTASIIEAGG